MDTTVVVGIIGAIAAIVAALVGALLGYRLNATGMQKQAKKIAKEQARSVRTLLRIEIDGNLAALRSLWDAITHADSQNAAPAPPQRLNRALSSPIPQWSHTMWQAQALLVTTALEEPKIREVYSVHNNLDSITTTCSQLAVLRTRRSEAANAARGRSGAGASFLATMVEGSYDQHMTELWEQCEQLIDATLQAGNPLQP